MLLIYVLLRWSMFRRSEYPNLLKRVAFKLHWNKPTGLACRFQMFTHLAEKQVSSAS